MRGFRIKFRSEEIVVTPDFRSSVTIFYSSSNGYELSVAGIKGFGDGCPGLLLDKIGYAYWRKY